MREYLQAHILFSLQAKRGFERLALVGGTALRFIYGMRRYSEDLDFSLERRDGYDFPSLLDRFKSDLLKAGFEVTVHPRQDGPIHSAFIRFSELLYGAGVTPHRNQKLSLKIEIDTNPPAGARMQTTVVNRHFFLALWHHDLPSLMAGKIHALLESPYTKGRDIYDLLWYLTRPEPVEPNIELLQNALAQTGWKEKEVTAANWKSIVREKLEGLDFAQVREDVGAFLEVPEERELLRKDILLSALEQGR